MKPKQLETERLILRAFALTDAEAMFNNWCNDPEVTKYMTWNPHGTLEVTKSLLSSWINEYEEGNKYRYGICLKENNLLIGSIDVVKFVDSCPEIGYCLSKQYWNNGFMTEALNELIRYLFELGYKKILIQADAENIRSNKVIQKCGFKFTHTEHRDYCSPIKLYPVDINCYELTKK